jgi:hypothetical protein
VLEGLKEVETPYVYIHDAARPLISKKVILEIEKEIQVNDAVLLAQLITSALKMKNKKSIANFIFFGKGNFQEPYTAPWLFEHGQFKKNYVMPFTVSTGSGRSRGKCTIVIKPK